MRILIPAVLLAISCVAPGQAAFEIQGPSCSYAFPVGCGFGGDPESVSSNGLAFSTIDVANGLGMPTQGVQYARIDGHNPGALNPPQGGPQPADGLVNELYIPIPAGALAVTLRWDFYNAEGGPSADYNDGMAIEVTPAACGAAIQTLVYADTFTAIDVGVEGGVAGCLSAGTEVAPAGPQTLGPVALPSGSAFIRVKVWNGGDDAVSSAGAIDDVTFTFAPVCTLTISAPFGPGSLAIFNTGCGPGDVYLTGITGMPGLFPFGWFFGIDIPIFELLGQIAFGPPFFGALDPAGGSLFFIPVGVPPGIPLYAVTATFDAVSGSTTGAAPPVAFVTL